MPKISLEVAISSNSQIKSTQKYGDSFTNAESVVHIQTSCTIVNNDINNTTPAVFARHFINTIELIFQNSNLLQNNWIGTLFLVDEVEPNHVHLCHHRVSSAKLSDSTASELLKLCVFFSFLHLVLVLKLCCRCNNYTHFSCKHPKMNYNYK